MDIKDKFERDIPDLLKQFMDRRSALMNMYTGKIEDNNDPEKLGRCRIRVFGIFDDKEIKTEDLPWAKPDNSFVGSKKGSLIIPPLNTLVRVYFDNNDVYNPVFTSKVANKVQIPTNTAEDYPNNMIFFETDNGDFLQINRASFELYFYHASGTFLSIDKDGNITIENKDAEGDGNLTMNIKGDINISSENGDVSVEANKGNIKLGGDLATQPIDNLPVCLFVGSPHHIGGQTVGQKGSTLVRP